jgi:hypothetical protein
MQNYYLKFENQEQLESVLIANDLAQIYDEQFAPKTNLDVIGLIYKPTGNIITTDGFEYPEKLPISGWHANIKADLTEEQEAVLTPFLVPEPIAPVRKWGGE